MNKRQAKIENIEKLREAVVKMLWPKWENYVYFGGGGGSLSPSAFQHRHKAQQEFEVAVDKKVLFYLGVGIKAEDILEK